MSTPTTSRRSVAASWIAKRPSYVRACSTSNCRTWTRTAGCRSSKRFGSATEKASGGASVRKNPARHPSPVVRRRPSSPTQAWFSDFSRVILSGVGRPSSPLTKLVKDARSSRYKVSSDVRTLDYQGRKVTSYRIVLVRGSSRYEVVVDGRRFLPVSVTNTIGPTDNTRWSAVRWSFFEEGMKPSLFRFNPSARG